MVSKSALSISRSKLPLLLSSPITISRGRASFSFSMPASHLAIIFSRSCSISSVSWPSAAVRIITPKLAGFKAFTILVRRWRSSLFTTRLLILMLSEKGTKIRNLPAKEISQLRRGPLVLMASLVT